MQTTNCLNVAVKLDSSAMHADHNSIS